MQEYLVISNFQPFFDIVEACYGCPCASEHLARVFPNPWHAFWYVGHVCQTVVDREDDKQEERYGNGGSREMLEKGFIDAFQYIDIY